MSCLACTSIGSCVSLSMLNLISGDARVKALQKKRWYKYKTWSKIWVYLKTIAKIKIRLNTHSMFYRNLTNLVVRVIKQNDGRDMTKPTKWLCAQRRLRSDWASAQSDQSSLSAWRKLGSLATHLAQIEDSDQTGRMPRLIWVFAGRTVTLLVCHVVAQIVLQCNTYRRIKDKQQCWFCPFNSLVCTVKDSFLSRLHIKLTPCEWQLPVMILSFRTDRGAVWSGSTLFAIPSASFGLITLWYSHIVQILEWLQQIFWVSEYLGNLQYLCIHNKI